MGFSLRYAALLVGVAACSPYGGGVFHCERDDQCSGGGTCEADGLCSFPDPQCNSGRRYGDLSGSVSNKCVGETGIDGVIDAPDPDGTIDTAIDSPPSAPFCDATNEPTLVGCWELEGNTTDASGDNNNATATNTTFGTGKVGMGLVLQANSLVAIPDSTSLSPPNLTVEAFVRPTALPTGGAKMYIFDNDGSYAISINSSGVQCVAGGTVNAAQLTVNAWTHVACTTDSTTTRLYINGVQAGMANSSALGNGNNNGSAIGGNSPNGSVLIGSIDQVRVWNAARTPAQICAASGATTCP